MSKDFRVATSFFTHKKTVRLIRELGIEGPWCLLKLWAWAREHCPDGDLEDLTELDIEEIVRWDNTQGDFVKTITSEDTLYLVCIDGKYVLHNWDKHNSWAVKSAERSEIARKNAISGWEKRKGKSKPQCKSNANGIQTPHAPSPSPSPLPSITSNETMACIELLKGINGYSIEEKDTDFIDGLIKDFPTISPICTIKEWSAYLMDNPFAKNAKPRAQLRNQFVLKKKYNRCGRETEVDEPHVRDTFSEREDM